MDYIQKFWNIIANKKNNVWIKNYIYADYNINNSIKLITLLDEATRLNLIEIKNTAFGNYNKYPSYINNIKYYNISNFDLLSKIQTKICYVEYKNNKDYINKNIITYKIDCYSLHSESPSEIYPSYININKHKK